MSGRRSDSKGNQKKKPLSNGWIVVPSKSYPDRVYFYNTVTRCSTWNNPCEVYNTDDSSENSSSENSSPERKRSSSKNSKTSKHNLQQADKNSNTKINYEIEDYDEQQDQYFKNVPLDAFNLSHSNIISPSSSPDSVSSLKSDENNLLENNDKQLWVHFLTSPEKPSGKKSVALSDLEGPSTSNKSEKVPLILSSSKDNFLKFSEANNITLEDSSSKKKKGKKKKRKHSHDERKGREEKIIKKVSFKKRDKTPAQTRLLKLRKQNAENLKKLAATHPELLTSKFDSKKPKKSNLVTKRDDSSSKPSVEQYNNTPVESGHCSEDEFDKEMDWEPSFEESDVRNINVFRQQEKMSDSSSDTFGFHYNQSSMKTHSWFVILDTNIFVSHLNFVKELRDIKVPDLGFPVIYVPWRVLQELDNLKDHKIESGNRHIQPSVRKAIAYLNENFKARHPRILGQSFEEFAKMIDVGTSAPDDEILQTCIKFKKEHPHVRLMLLTNDKNLESKAIVSGVEVYSKDRFQDKFLRQNAAVDTPETFSSAFAKSNNQTIETDNYICEIKTILEDFLPLVVKTEMQLAFKDDWIKLSYKKPPWSLQDALECFLKHWRSVFFVVFPKETHSEAQQLFDKLYKKEAGSTEDVISIIKTIQRLILSIKRSLKKKKPYSDAIEIAVTKLSSLLSSLSPNESFEVETIPLSMNEQVFPNEMPEADVFKIRNLFKEILLFLKSFCSSISDVINSIPGAVPEYRLKLEQILNNVAKLVHCVEELFEVDQFTLTEQHPLITQFSIFLIHVYPSMDPELQKILPECLVLFFKDTEGRSLLASAMNDFREFSQELMKAIQYFDQAYLIS